MTALGATLLLDLWDSQVMSSNIAEFQALKRSLKNPEKKKIKKKKTIDFRLQQSGGASTSAHFTISTCRNTHTHTLIAYSSPTPRLSKQTYL